LGPATKGDRDAEPTTNLYDTEPKSATKAAQLPKEVYQQAGPLQPDLSHFDACPVDVVADGAFTCLRRHDGTVHCFGAYQPVLSGRYMQIDTGRASVCGVRVDGQLECREDPSQRWGIGNPPYLFNSLVPFRQVSVGSVHACALDDLGEITCWGRDYGGQVSNSLPGSDFIQVAAGTFQTCALRGNGSVECWGDLTRFTPPPNESFVRIDAETWTHCGISINGGLHCWGDTRGPRVHAYAPGGSFDFVDVGVYDGCALDGNGTARCWSPPTQNTVLGVSANVPRATFVDVAAGYHHACGLTVDDKVLCWGRNAWGEGSPPTFPCNPDASEADWELGTTLD
jgi:hypothetical protein